MAIESVTSAGTDVKAANSASRQASPQDREQGEAQQAESKDQTDKSKTANELNQVGTNVNVTT